jgi:hypothetical protein
LVLDDQGGVFVTITVTLSTPIGKRLQTQADKIDLPLDDLVERMLIASLPVYEANGFHATADEPVVDDFPTLEEIVAQIKATPPNPNAIQRGEKFGDMAYIQSLLDNPPTDTLTVAEWEEYWPAFEQELKELDRNKLQIESAIVTAPFIIARAIAPVNPVNFAVI